MKLLLSVSFAALTLSACNSRTPAQIEADYSAKAAGLEIGHMVDIRMETIGCPTRQNLEKAFPEWEIGRGGEAVIANNCIVFRPRPILLELLTVGTWHDADPQRAALVRWIDMPNGRAWWVDAEALIAP
jgi:hypothetical protein